VGPWSRDGASKEELPRGPRGSREPSTASRRVGWAPNFRGVRGWRVAGDAGAFDADGADDSDGGSLEVDAVGGVVRHCSLRGCI
jgi:hypothetical protein